MSNILENSINQTIGRSLSTQEMSLAISRISEYVQCLIILDKEQKNNESRDSGQSKLKRTRGRVQSRCPDFTPFRLCE